MNAVYRKSTPSFTTVKIRTSEFYRKCTCFEEDVRKELVKIATTGDSIPKVHEMLLDDRRIKCNNIGFRSKTLDHRFTMISDDPIGNQQTRVPALASSIRINSDVQFNSLDLDPRHIVRFRRISIFYYNRHERQGFHGKQISTGAASSHKPSLRCT
ncbi:hypothetical protein NPIL_13721 [Nephila pilipes]|uniref:Uncharacterized protein n=1 Tax=Nephila pilipes TaxID=299642 RepID=A0A8X6TDR8_NEPPI|nr:hypothetical protein NPIL_13721 [Nephila pilipes]